MTNSIKHAVSGLFRFPNGDILVQDHVKLGKLNIPSGKVEYGERSIEAIKREMMEELGVDVTELTIANLTTHKYRQLAGKDGHLEYRYEYNVSDDFLWKNAEPEKHNWIERMNPAKLHMEKLDLALILTSVLKTELTPEQKRKIKFDRSPLAHVDAVNGLGGNVDENI